MRAQSIYGSTYEWRYVWMKVCSFDQRSKKNKKYSLCFFLGEVVRKGYFQFSFYYFILHDEITAVSRRECITKLFKWRHSTNTYYDIVLICGKKYIKGTSTDASI